MQPVKKVLKIQQSLNQLKYIDFCFLNKKRIIKVMYNKEKYKKTLLLPSTFPNQEKTIGKEI